MFVTLPHFLPSHGLGGSGSVQTPTMGRSSGVRDYHLRQALATRHRALCSTPVLASVDCIIGACAVSRHPKFPTELNGFIYERLDTLFSPSF